MASESTRVVNIEVALETKNQTRDDVLKAVDLILEHYNCRECGLMGVISARSVAKSA
jgi:hypothetical protein